MDSGHLLVFLIFSLILTFIFKCWNRFWRHMNIRKHGYPPKWCDADGDLKKEDSEEL